MKKHFFSMAIACLFSFLFTGCIDIMEDLVLNKDGSGKYDLTIDMSEMFENPLMKGAFEAGDDKENPMKDMDSVVYFKDMPDSLKGANPDVWDRTSVRIVINQKNEKFYTTIHCDYKNFEELAYVSENMDKMMNAAKNNPLSGGDLPTEASPTGLLGKGIKYKLNGKELIRSSAPSGQADESVDDMEMMKSFLAGAEYKANFTLPGKVKKVTIPGAKIDGKKVSVVVSMLDMMEKKLTMDGSIRFR